MSDRVWRSLYFESGASALLDGGDTEQHANGLGHAPLPADDPALVVLCDLEPENYSVVLPLLNNPDIVRSGGDRLGYVLDEVFQRSYTFSRVPRLLSIRSTASDGFAP